MDDLKRRGEERKGRGEEVKEEEGGRKGRGEKG